ncbi:hypothetical protein TVAGG3_1065610 [Trichomonas vaginalis G3]|uniref:uncharacterized protein n=1 Tax=Trichomonas vaginalis (strain ATCC PRA-98 / G3) TaxID=412133 RepID=UPI0021E5FF97|nr:uncharacterized protein TVAGG3_1065610 [Trichomonas vaginalis G3]KAI5483342.1 hypothetical protein TVAGG3_1065610 [Trichomonas vaginalis G3]
MLMMNDVESDDDVPQYYSFTSSMYSGSDGIQHIHREEVDSKSGLRKVLIQSVSATSLSQFMKLLTKMVKLRNTRQ